MIGRTVSHYKILDKLGEGGMGVVYKAQDTRLDRIVALKFLPPGAIPSSEDAFRFEREAKAISALNHPHIATLYDVGEADGRKFLVLEYLPGNTLKAGIQRLNSEDKPLSFEQIRDYASQIAGALAHAHGQGFVHRDVKSDNILFTAAGNVKLTDFGLTKSREGAGLTKLGSAMGTAAYMSPEQARGEEADERSDIWSLGIVLYEMAAGRLPFTGDYEQAILYAVMNEPHPPVAGFRAGVPSDLEEIINKCLQKKAADRFQHTSEIVQLLTPAAAAAPSPVEKSIVVLPFENISPDKDNEYFSDGLTEEVIADLSNIRTLRVISRSSAMTLKGTRKTVRTIGKELGVRYVLEGSVRKAGGQLRITAQLIDAATDAHLWAEKYNGTVDDIFDIQEKVSRSIAEALKLKLTTEEKSKLAERPIADVQAYDGYLRARYAIHSWKEKELEQALELLNRALEQVGENPLLYASQGYVYFQLVNAGYRQEEYISKAEESAKKALALDPHSVHAHRLRGVIDSSFRGDQRSGYRHLKQVLDSDPFDAESLYWLAITYANYGKIEESRNFVDRFLRIDPLNVVSQLLHGWIHFQDGHFDKAFAPLERAYQTDPASPLHRFAFGLALAYSGRVQEAIRFIDVLQRIEPPTFFDRIVLLLLYGLKGEKQPALEQVTEEVRTTAKRDFQWSWHLAVGYAVNGENEKALEWLENAVNLGFINYPMLARYDPFLAGLRGEKRCQKLLERAKYEWEHFEA